jgi:capsular exopolysaccharide synthesis family protein
VNPLALKKNKKAKTSDHKRKLVTKHNSKSPIAEQYRTIRTNIEFSAVDGEMKTIMVTSSGPGEGKSTTASNLAVVFAQQGKKVLLVDADLRKPTAHYTFNLTNTFGLTSVLTKQMDLAEAAAATDEENLFILPSGPIPPNPAEVLGSRAMEEFLSAATDHFDFVLFDTPPMLAVADPQILANKVDGAILVVSSGTTEIEQAVKAKELLQNAKSKLLGAVLNNKKVENAHYYYYYSHK